MRSRTGALAVLAAALTMACGSGEEARPVAPPAAPAAPAAAAATPVPASPPTRPVASGRPRIVFLGDSLTAGLGLAPSESVPALVAARIAEKGYDYEVVNAGVSGDTSAGGLNRLEWSLDGDVKLLVIELGANDGLRGLPVDAMKRNLDQIITRAKARGVTVVLTGMEAPPNYGAAYTTEFRNVFRDLARDHRVAFVPFFLDGVAGIPSLNQNDGIHPNPEGARIVERSIWKTLEPLLEDAE